MQEALQITFRGMDPSPAVEAKIRELAERLTRFDPHITTCHVRLEQPHRHQQQGAAFDVHIRVATPGGEVVVTHAGRQDVHEDAYVALRAAFDAASRQLADRVRSRDHRGRAPEPA